MKTAFKMFDEDGNGVLEEHEFLGRCGPGGPVP